MTYLLNFHLPTRRALLTSLFTAGCTLALTSCGDGVPPASQTIVFDEVENDLYVQPIRVCDDFGQNCARMNLFADLTAQILKQAKLKVNFLPANQLNESRFLTIGDEAGGTDELYELSRQGDNADYGRHPDSERTSGPINVWFVHDIQSTNGNTQFGSAWVDANGVIISEATLDFDGGKGRRDTLAHEIGHNLGLKHTTLGAGGANNLLTDGNRRNVPSGIEDVYPNGAGTSTLTSAQITEILSSGFVTEAHAEGDAHTEGMDELAADLAQVSLLSLQARSTASDKASVPEPSGLLALGLVGLSSMLVLKRR
ncbi:MAG: reprolysin-like metallopeptidase [Phormidesmis sp.]